MLRTELWRMPHQLRYTHGDDRYKKNINNCLYLVESFNCHQLIKFDTATGAGAFLRLNGFNLTFVWFVCHVRRHGYRRVDL